MQRIARIEKDAEIKAASSSRAINTIVTRSCGHIFLSMRGVAWLRCAAEHAVAPRHSSRSGTRSDTAVATIESQLPTSTSNFVFFANYYTIASLSSFFLEK